MTELRDLIHELRIELAQYRLLNAKPCDRQRRGREFMELIRRVEAEKKSREAADANR